MVSIYPFYTDPDDIVKLAPEDQQGGKPAEAELYRLLKEQLPDDWFVLYDIAFTGKPNENQIDFLVIVPHKGIVNLECKGGGYTVENSGRRFKHPSNKLPQNGDLIEKARKVAENFLKTFNDSLDINLGAFQKAVIFPLHNFSNDGQQKNEQTDYFNFSNEPVFTSKDVHTKQNPLKSIIEKLLDQSKQFHKYYKEGSAKTLFEHFQQCGKAKDELHNLNLQRSNQQIDYNTSLVGSSFSRFIFGIQSPYVHFSGTAGTGKTWIATDVARKFAQGHPQSHILYVCYNKTLAADVSLKLKDLENVDVGHFHRLARICYDQKNLIVVNQKKFDEQQTDKAFLDYMDAGNEPKYKYDLILVDEAQDFVQIKFDFIAGLASSKNRKIVFFSDINQNIHSQNNNYPCFSGKTFAPTITLESNLRNTVDICEYSKKLIEDDITQARNEKGPQVEIIENANIDQIKDDLIELRTKYSDSKIAILSDRADFSKKLKNKQIEFVSCADSASFEIIQDNLTMWRDPKKNTIWASTIHAFKGLEADIVLLILHPNNCESALHYVGATRAKYCLKIFILND